MNREHEQSGSLSLAASRPGCIVRYVRKPSEQFQELWRQFLTGPVWKSLPEVGNEYLVRANTHGPDSFREQYRSGVLLASKVTKLALKNDQVQVASNLFYEPYFPFNCFNLVEIPTRGPRASRW